MIDPQNVTFLLALFGGFISFISPCVLPLVPAYLGYLSSQANPGGAPQTAAVGGAAGGGTATVQEGATRFGVFLHGVFFVLGFSVIFILLGLGAGVLGSVRVGLIGSLGIITTVGGILIVILGLHTMGVIRIPFLYYDTRKQKPPRKDLGYAGSSLMGVVFSAGWSPCIGPILGAVLTLGFNTNSVGRATGLLAAYSIGLGIPFLLAALAMDRATVYMRRFQKHMRKVEIVSGIFLIAVGILVFTGSLQRLSGGLASSEFVLNFTTNLEIFVNDKLLGL